MSEICPKQTFVTCSGKRLLELVPLDGRLNPLIVPTRFTVLRWFVLSSFLGREWMVIDLVSDISNSGKFAVLNRIALNLFLAIEWMVIFDIFNGGKFAVLNRFALNLFLTR